MYNPYECLNAVRGNDDWLTGPCGENPGELKKEIEQLQAELAAAISIMRPLRLESEKTGITYGGCEGGLGFLLHGKAIGSSVEDVIQAVAAKAEGSDSA